MLRRGSAAGKVAANSLFRKPLGAGLVSTPHDILAGMPGRRSLSTWLYGPAPPADAPQSQMLRWIRRLLWRLSLWCVPLLVVGISVSFPLWLWIVLGVAAVIMLANQLVLSLRIHRLERNESQQPG